MHPYLSRDKDFPLTPSRIFCTHPDVRSITPVISIAATDLIFFTCDPYHLLQYVALLALLLKFSGVFVDLFLFKIMFNL